MHHSLLPEQEQIILHVRLYETAKVALCYPKVETPLTQGAQTYALDTRHLYHPEPPPTVNPPLPASFRIDVEEVTENHHQPETPLNG